MHDIQKYNKIEDLNAYLIQKENQYKILYRLHHYEISYILSEIAEIHLTYMMKEYNKMYNKI